MADGMEQADEAVRRMRELLATITREVRARLAALDTQRGSSLLETDARALAQASRVRTQLVALLRRRGAEVIDDVLTRKAVEAAQAVSRQFGFGTVPVDARATIAEVVRGQRDEILATFGDAADAVGAAMRIGVTTAAPLDEHIDKVATILDTSYLRAQASVDAAVMGAARAVTLDAGTVAEGTTSTALVYVYTGPDDIKTRDFCRAHVGRAFTRAALERLDNGAGQPKPTAVYLGGYNCRHTLAVLPREIAKARGITIVE